MKTQLYVSTDAFSYMDYVATQVKTVVRQSHEKLFFPRWVVYIILRQRNTSEVQKKYRTRLCLCRQAMLIWVSVGSASLRSVALTRSKKKKKKLEFPLISLSVSAFCYTPQNLSPYLMVLPFCSNVHMPLGPL